jgi:phage-related minor tail protein
VVERNLSYRLSLKDADVVKRGLQSLGKEGQDALRRIETSAQPASRGLLAVNAVTADLTGKLDEFSGRAGTAGRALSALGPGGIAAAVGIGAALAALTALYAKGKEALSFADDIGDVADQLGLTAEQLQEIRASYNGLVEPGEVDGALAKMRKLVGDAANGGKEAIAVFDELKVSIRDSVTGQVRSPVEVYRDVADAIASIESPAQRSAAASAIFGREVGGKMVPVLSQASAGLDEAAAKFRALGAIISNETVAQAGALQQQLDDLGLVIKAQVTETLVRAGPEIVAFTRQVGEILPPLVRDAADALQYLADHGEEAVVVVGALVGLAVGSAFGPWGAAIGLVAGALGGVALAGHDAKGSVDALNLVQETNKRLINEINTATQTSIGLTREEAAANRDRARSLLASASARRAEAQGRVREAAAMKTVPGQVMPGQIVEANLNAGQAQSQAEADEIAAGIALADAQQALNEADRRAGELGKGGGGKGAFLQLGEDVDGVAKKIADFAQKSRLDAMKPLARQLEENRLKYVELGNAVAASLLPDEKKRELVAQLAEAFNQNNNSIRANAAEHKAGASATKQATSALQEYLTKLAQEKALVGLSAEEQAKKKAITEAEAAAVKDFNNHLRDKNTLTDEERAKVEALAASGKDLQDRLDALVKDQRTPEEAAAVARAQMEALRPLATTAEQIAAIDRGLASVDQKLRDQDPLYKELDSIGTRAFDRIGSAITEAFTQGNGAAVDFGTVAQGVISEIMQDFIRLAAINPLKNALGLGGEKGLPTLSGFGDLITKGINFIGGGSGGSASDPGGLIAGGSWAKGGAFDRGRVIPFARGGVVERPTLFPMATGAGLMGEAGPEGIIPLARMSDGKLGVTAAGGGESNVQVNIINNAGVKVQTRESRDGRGNRRVEVALGDMWAQEAGRPGSSANRGVASALSGPTRR